jgi:hypothetical protein
MPVWPEDPILERRESMISIESVQGPRGATLYRITLFEPGLESKGRKFDAHSIHEVHTAIDHYFKANHALSMRNCCPLCRGERI